MGYQVPLTTVTVQGHAQGENTWNQQFNIHVKLLYQQTPVYTGVCVCILQYLM